MGVVVPELYHLLGCNCSLLLCWVMLLLFLV